MTTIDTVEQARLVTGILETWADGIRAHEPHDVASTFTDDALFQGFDPVHTIGRTGIAAYYAKQPVGLGASFNVIEQRQIASDTLLAYVRVDFTPPDAAVIPVHLTVVIERRDDQWRISHYHVSKIERPNFPDGPA